MHPIVDFLGVLIGTVVIGGVFIGLMTRFGSRDARMDARQFRLIDAQSEWYIHVFRLLAGSASLIVFLCCVTPRVPLGVRDGVYGGACGLIMGGLLVGLILDGYATGMLGVAWFERMIRRGARQPPGENLPNNAKEDRPK